MYGRKRRSADYWDYDYKLYDFDYEPGCSLSYQQTQFNTNLKDRLAQMMDPKSNKHIIILSEQNLKMDRRNILWTRTKKHFLIDSKKNSSQSIQFS